MSAIIHGDHHAVWGVKTPLPLKGFPQGKVRLRIRNNDFVHAYVKTKEGIRHFIVAEKDGFWVPEYEQGANHREDAA
jgi:hypothetical protein